MTQLSPVVTALASDLAQTIGLFGAVWPADGTVNTAPLKRSTRSLSEDGLDQCSNAKKQWFASFEEVAAIIHTPSRPCLETAALLAADDTEILEISGCTSIRLAGSMSLYMVLERSNPNLELEIRLKELLEKLRLLRKTPTASSLLVMVDDTPLARLIAYAIACSTGTNSADMHGILDTQLKNVQGIIVGNPTLIPQLA